MKNTGNQKVQRIIITWKLWFINTRICIYICFFIDCPLLYSHSILRNTFPFWAHSETVCPISTIVSRRNIYQDIYNKFQHRSTMTLIINSTANVSVPTSLVVLMDLLWLKQNLSTAAILDVCFGEEGLGGGWMAGVGVGGGGWRRGNRHSKSEQILFRPTLLTYKQTHKHTHGVQILLSR